MDFEVTRNQLTIYYIFVKYLTKMEHIESLHQLFLSIKDLMIQLGEKYYIIISLRLLSS